MGDHCDEDIDECLPTNPCQNGGSCVVSYLQSYGMFCNYLAILDQEISLILIYTHIYHVSSAVIQSVWCSCMQSYMHCIHKKIPNLYRTK